MSDSVSAREIIERLVKQAGIKKKLAAEILRVIPQIIEEGLLRDGEVRVKGLGTFRLKWVRSKTGRNPKTGERIEIPAHNRLVFLPEQSFKEYINRDYRLLSYKIIPGSEEESVVGGQQSAVGGQQSAVSSQESQVEGRRSEVDGQWSEVDGQWSEVNGRRSVVDGQWSEVMPEPDVEVKPEPELPVPVRKHRIHWIIPAAISVIVVLSLIFYFRNFYPVGDQQSAVGGQQSEVSGQQSTVDNERPVPTAQPEGTASDSSQSADSSQQSAVISPLPDSLPHIGGGTGWGQNSELRIIPRGKHLFQLAREIYGNPYLWVLIYRENQDKINDPDMLISGKELLIPALEGTPEKLTRKDSLAVSDGYRLLYEYFGAKEDTRTDDFFKAMERYKPD